jgi:hypothetical protein
MWTRFGKIKGVLIVAFLVVFIIAGILVSMLFTNKLYETVTLEAGTKTVNISEFLKDKKTSGTIVTDMSTINMNSPGVYDIKIQIGNKTYSSKLEIKDTVAPAAEVVNNEIWAKEEKEAKEFVKNIVDATDVKVSFKEKPDFSKAGNQDVLLILEDAGYNKTELKAAVTIKADTEAPKIEGTHDQTVYIGDTVAYKKDVTVTDNRDENVKLEIDSNSVNLKKAGAYNVTYSATDSSGNTTTKTITLKVTEKPKSAVSKEDLDALADKVLASIITTSMSKKEKAKAIFKWTKSNISYIDTSDKSDWVKAAIQGFKQGKGDCFVYFATAQELLTRAGIQNQGIIKINNHHFWSLINLGDGWYHFDTTPRKGDNDFYSLFMLTDAQIEAYSRKHGNSHVWDKTKYPATPAN